MLEALVADGKVRAKHGGAELVAITAVADECVNQIFAFDRLMIIIISETYITLVLR
jgi:hypothetical protein